MSDTTGTRPDPEGFAEGDGNQLQPDDTLVDRGLTDVLDEGYSPPDRPRRNHHGETRWEEQHGETLDERLAEEEPEIWEATTRLGRDEHRAGRLVADVDAVDGRDNDTYGSDAGIDGAGASAEEAAIHITREP